MAVPHSDLTMAVPHSDLTMAVPHSDLFWYCLNGMGAQKKKCAQKTYCNIFSISISNKNYMKQSHLVEKHKSFQ